MKPVGTIIGTKPEIDVFELKKQAPAIRGKPLICVLGPELNLDRNLVLLEGLKSLNVPASCVRSRSFGMRIALINSEDSRFLGKHRKF
jgi:hypothetical protein